MMQDFEKWTLDAIRSEDASFSWLEEYRFEWTKTIQVALSLILDGKSAILITDYDREWFGVYIKRFINKTSNARPLICVLDIEQVYSHFDEISDNQSLDMIEDMLNISLQENYFFWYIGKGEDKRADIAKRKDDSLMWLFDEDTLNAFTMQSNDEKLDIKLLQLFHMFDISLNAALFGEINVSR